MGLAFVATVLVMGTYNTSAYIDPEFRCLYLICSLWQVRTVLSDVLGVIVHQLPTSNYSACMLVLTSIGSKSRLCHR